jgi:hypothetical protein
MKILISYLFQIYYNIDTNIVFIMKQGWKAWRFFLWCTKLTCMAYLGLPFQLLQFQQIIHFYKTLYFSGHILGFVLYVLLQILKMFLLKRSSQTEDHKNK